ncbi:MAG: hypothetical protein GX219_02360 [Tissierellia bacterium]|nr:hypothetical protein [Tissierellia bacterium]
MDKNLIKKLILVGYAIPFPFLAMAEDLFFRSMFFYLIMIIALSFLCRSAMKHQAIPYALVGSVLSVVLSQVLILFFIPAERSGYFKPFTPRGLAFGISRVALVIQLAVWYFHKMIGCRKQKSRADIIHTTLAK